jgi:hypothetical protein
VVEVGRITILDGSVIGDGTIYSDGDMLITLYNDATDTITVELNGTPVTSGELMLGKWQSLGVISILNAGVEFCQGSNLVTFGVSGVATREFPYFPKNIEVDSPTCSTFVCQILKYNDPIVTPATGAFNADGEITVEAANITQVNFGIGNFDFADGQPGTLIATALPPINNIYRTTLTGLFPGTYNVIGKDTNGCQVSYKVVVGFVTVSNVKYFSEFRDKFNNIHKVELLFDNYTGSATELLTHSDTPLTVNWGGLKLGNIDLDKFITALSAKMTYTLRVSDNYSFIDEFAQLSDGQVQMKHYLKVGESYILQNQGNVILDNYSEPYKGAPYPISLYATDGLEFLDNFDYPNTSGIASYMNIIVTCLSFTRINNNIISLMNLFEDDMDQSASDDPLTQLYVNQEVFAGKKCNEVLGELLTLCPAKAGSVGATITSKFGNWYIYPVEATDNAVPFRKFDSLGNYIENGSINIFRFFKGESDTTRAVMLEGGNNLRLDRTFKDIIVNEQRLITQSVSPLFVPENITNPQSGLAGRGTGFDGWNNFLATQDTQIFIQNVLGNLVLQAGYSQAFGRTLTDNSFISTTGIIDFIANDILKIDVDMFMSADRVVRQGAENIPYFVFKYSIQIGSTLGDIYFWDGLSWVLTDNEIQVEQFTDTFNGEFSNVIQTVGMPPYGGRNTKDYTIKIYIPNPIKARETTLQPGVNPWIVWGIVNSLQAINTADLPLGYRVATYTKLVNNVELLNYFSLQGNASGDNVVSIEATGSDNFWVWNAGTQLALSPSYTFYIKSINVITLPNGIPVNETNETVITNSITAPRDFRINLPLFDLDNGIFNGINIVKNYLRLFDGTPTKLWDGDSLKNILRNTYARQYKLSNRIINFTANTDVDINPFNTMIIEADNNRALRFYELEQDVRRHKISGTIMEIGSDTPITVGEYSDDYSNDYFN